MKKIYVILTSIVVGLLLIITSGTIVKADSSYDITNYDMNINVSDDGNAEVIQKVTYNFDGDFYGVYLNLDFKGTKGSTDPKVQVKQNGQLRDLKQAYSQADNTYELSKQDDVTKIKVFHTISDAKATYIYKYRVNGVVTNYLDTAMINWKVVGNNWDNSMDHVNISINLPAKNIDQLQGWAHGPSNGDIKIHHDTGRVTLAINGLPENQFVETRIIFPDFVTAKNTNIVHKNVKTKVIKQERDLATAANKKRHRDQATVYAMVPVIMAVIIGLFIWVLLFWKKNPDTKVKQPIPLHHWFEIPEMKPSKARMIVKKADKTDFTGLTGDMLDEVAHKNLNISPDGKSYQIEKTDHEANPYFKFLIDKIGDGKKVSFKQIKQSKNEDLYYEHQLWQDRSTEGRDEYFSTNNSILLKRVNKVFIWSVVLSIFMNLTMFAVMPKGMAVVIPVGIIAILAASILLIIAKRTISPFTQKGADTFNELRGFRNMLQDIEDINLAEVGDLILWEQILPYAAAFGISKKVIDALKVQYGEEITNIPMIGYYYVALGSMNNPANLGTVVGQSYSSFNASINSNYSDPGGFSGGGFSGGSSGGFGGGSGGGAF